MRSVREHAHALLFERVFVLRLHRVVDDALEHLNYQEKEHVRSIHQLAVLPVRFAVAHEHPQSLHHPAFNDHRRCVPVMLVPDVLRDALNQFEVAQVLVERASRVLRIFVHCQLRDRPLVVYN